VSIEAPVVRRGLEGCPLLKERIPMSATDRIVRLHRVLCAPPERVYRAFLDADALAKWLPPHGFTCHVHAMDTRVGGRFRLSFTDFTGGHSHAFGGEYLELVPHERLRYTDVFDDPGLSGQMVTTVHLVAVSCGTELHVEQSNIPAAIPLEGCYVGWQQSLQLLAQLVEAVLPQA